eukprot:1195771-Prorocentrum_minimum.AAC.7
MDVIGTSVAALSNATNSPGSPGTVANSPARRRIHRHDSEFAGTAVNSPARRQTHLRRGRIHRHDGKLTGTAANSPARRQTRRRHAGRNVAPEKGRMPRSTAASSPPAGATYISRRDSWRRNGPGNGCRRRSPRLPCDRKWRARPRGHTHMCVRL